MAETSVRRRLAGLALATAIAPQAGQSYKPLGLAPAPLSGSRRWSPR
ncbi:hypothetical protein [Phenylobacterium sp.]|nr:hypothetical protein [Phenylobacterium sp.]HLZ76412.1 hypothetical protein [Phenylobacterium sp.]